MIIKGLESNGFFINNPIYIEVSELVNTKYIEVTLTYAGVNSVTYKLYSDLTGKVLVNLASMVRVMLPIPVANTDYTNNTTENTVHELGINIKEYKTDNTTTEQSFVKKFVRGGKLGNLINQVAQVGLTLTNSKKLPVWRNRPVALYDMTNDLTVGKHPIVVNINYFDDNYNIDVEVQSTRYTDGVYLKFLNSLGGYSYWNFERSSTKIKTDNIGYYVTPSISGEQVTDMGQEVQEESTAESVVKAEYIGILQDLITSSEVYKYDGDNNWERIILDGNSLTLNPVKKVYDVSISFKRHNTFTPTTLI
ncbi:hypothetical protein [uncultured Empedobacter sp.]|uniref:hypothetical protein n=1 Tax=uncultured Empedobacter sp. TaxID=410844 RepID=UPI0025D15A6D|nr:hypothetical protein [uncultured Empedobacter sp.]